MPYAPSSRQVWEKDCEKKSWNFINFTSHWVRNMQLLKTDLHKSQFPLCKSENEEEIVSVATQSKLFFFS